MLPGTRIVYAVVGGRDDVRRQPRLVSGWTKIGDGHGQELLAPVAVMGYGGFIDFEERKGPKIIDPHGQRICFKEAAITLLALLQRRLGHLSIGDVFKRPLVVKDLATGRTGGSNIFGDPNSAPVLAINFGFKAVQDVLFFDQTQKVAETVWVDVAVTRPTGDLIR